MASSCYVGDGRFVLHFPLAKRWNSLSALVVSVAFVAQCLGATTESTKSEVDRLVSAAAQAKIGGDLLKSSELLGEAVRIDPENQLAHWQLGQVKIDKQWATIEESQRRASADPLLAEYRERRAAAGDAAEGQLALAKWCRKKGLTDEALFHWGRVLAVDPKNAEALRALDLHWQNGRWMSRQQIADYKAGLRVAKRAAERWNPKIVGWRRAVTGQNSAARDAALAEISGITEADAIPSVEEVTLGRETRDSRSSDASLKITISFINALGKIQGQAAAQSLARHAVFAADESARTLAVEKLKPRDQHEYMPLLLSALGMPIEATYSVTTGPDGSVHYLRSLFREGPEKDWAWDSQHSAIQRDLSDHTARVDLKTNTVEEGPTLESKIRTEANKADRAATYQKRYGKDVAVTESQVAQANKAAETLNSRIVPVLAKITGESYGDNPKVWWDWWRNKNEYYTSDHPVERLYNSGADNFDYTFAELRPHSCFGKGTLVWTKTGRKAIETIEPGDLVLAQDINTGELRYKAVMRRTVRPASPWLKISAGEEELRVTGGHALWVSGVGWRMAKELGDNAVLHGVSQPLTVRSVKPGENGEAYNLIVADFNTYFVGESGVLAHDITPQRPTQAVLPGVAKTLVTK